MSREVIGVGVAGIALVAWLAARVASRDTVHGLLARILRRPRVAALLARTDLARRTWVGVLVVSLAWLLVGFVAVVALGWVFGELVRFPPAVAVDRAVYRFFLRGRAPALDTVWNTVTRVGDVAFVTVAAVVIGVVFSILRRSPLPALLAALSVVGERALQRGLELAVGSPAPSAALAVGKPGPFPSGGAARAMATYGLAAFLVWTMRPRARVAVAAWAVAAALIFVEGYTRVYLGRHWPVDVLGGWLAGALWLLVLIGLDALARPSAGASAGGRRTGSGASRRGR